MSNSVYAARYFSSPFVTLLILAVPKTNLNNPFNTSTFNFFLSTTSPSLGSVGAATAAAAVEFGNTVVS